MKQIMGARKVILYGAGTQNLRMVYQPLVSSGCKVDYICDRDREKQGNFFNGVEIIAPEKLREMCGGVPRKSL